MNILIKSDESNSFTMYSYTLNTLQFCQLHLNKGKKKLYKMSVNTKQELTHTWYSERKKIGGFMIVPH